MTGWLLAAMISIPEVRGYDVRGYEGTRYEGTLYDQVRSDNVNANDAGGQVTLSGDWLPKRNVAELRSAAAAFATLKPADGVRLHVDAFVEGLVADRGGLRSAAVLEFREGWVELSHRRADVRAGWGRLPWGRLDEIQPTDVVNPLDAARYLFDGRSAARLGVAFVRGRVFAGERLTLEAVVAPFFRRGRFDSLDEPTSPFNLLHDFVAGIETPIVDLPIERRRPSRSWSNVSGGGRVSATLGRVDATVAAYRGFESFGVVANFVEVFPRFTMVGGDFETVVGAFTVRGEAALFVERHFAGLTTPAVVRGRAIESGAGFDVRAGEYRVYASFVTHRRWSDDDPAIERSDVELVGSIERRFDRDRYLVRVFGVVNPPDASGFLRGLAVWDVRDNLAIEGSFGLFAGTSDDTIGRFRGRDFILARIRYHF